MAVFSKFAVSVVAVAVGYEEERCETASALQMKKFCNAVVVGTVACGKVLNEAVGGESRVLTVPEVSVGRPIKDGDLIPKSAIGFKNNESLKKSKSAPGTSSPENDLAKLMKNGGITLDMINNMKGQLSDANQVKAVLKEIGCDAGEQKTMSNLLHYISSEGIATKVKEQFSKKTHAAIQFKQTFDELFKQGSKCELKDVIQRLLTSREIVLEMNPNLKTSVIELFRKPMTKELGEQYEMSGYAKAWLRIGAVLGAMAILMCVVAAYIQIYAGQGNYAGGVIR